MAAIADSRRFAFLRRPAKVRAAGNDEPRMPRGKQIMFQALCIFIAITVLFPIVWIFSMSIDPRNFARPDGLNLIPPGASFEAYAKVLARPTSNPVSFLDLARNSLI